MKITFNIDYRTNWGESLYITGGIPQLGDRDFNSALKMTLDGSSRWTATVDAPDNATVIDYRYQVRNDNGTVKNEWGPDHRFNRGRSARVYEIYDRWQDQPLLSLIHI